jgi:pimeloyl-ACP methyl ester carboxylesterase
MKRFTVQNAAVSLECLEAGTPGTALPLLIVPGLSEDVDDWLAFADAMAPRLVYILSLRGRGASDAPASGYALEDHVGDIQALVRDRRLTRFCLFGFSRAVSYALAFALAQPECLAGLILGDYPSRHTRLPDDFAAGTEDAIWRGRRVGERMALHARSGLQKDSADVGFAHRLQEIACPTLILAGNPELGGLLSEDDKGVYLDKLRQGNIVSLPDSGHDLHQPTADPLFISVRGFLQQLDKNRFGGAVA